MSRKVREKFYTRLLETASNAPDKALDICVTDFLRAKTMLSAILSAQAGLAILTRHSTSLSSYDRIEAIESLTIRPDTPLDDGEYRGEHYINATVAETDELIATQDQLLAHGILLLQDSTLLNTQKYLFVEELLENTPPNHIKYPILIEWHEDIAALYPEAIHLCPYKHLKMGPEAVHASINRAGIPNINKYNCLWGMWDLSNGNRQQERGWQLFEELEKLRILDPKLCDHIISPIPEPAPSGRRRKPPAKSPPPP